MQRVDVALERRPDSEGDDRNQMSATDRHAICDVLCRLGEDDKIWLTRRVKTLIVRVLGKNVTPAGSLLAEALFEQSQTCVTVPEVFMGTVT